MKRVTAFVGRVRDCLVERPSARVGAWGRCPLRGQTNQIRLDRRMICVAHFVTLREAIDTAMEKTRAGRAGFLFHLEKSENVCPTHGTCL